MTQEQILKAVFSKQSDAIQQVIRRTCIVDYGVIVKVLGDNVVRVGISVADNVEDVQIITCTLVTLCSSAISVNIEAVEGDKVLVVFPRHFNPQMFNTGKKDPIIDDSIEGYTRYAGLALLINQFDYSSHRKNINISADGVLSVRLPYDENDTANVITAQTDSEGKISLDIAKDSDEDDADLVTLTVDQDGNADLTLQQGDVSVIKASSEGTLEYGVGDTNKITADLSDQDNNTITVSDSNGISVETSIDSDENSVMVVKQGEDGAITISSKGTLEYSVGDTNKITADLSDQSGNSITISDSNGTSIETSSDGMTITDTNDNSIETTSSGLTITDANGCTYETSSEGTVINGNLKVKK